MIGQTISHYKILEKLGEGGMGVVYKAHDTKLDRTVALKFLPHRLTSNQPDKSRFLQEAKSASALNHPNICTIYYLEEVGAESFIVMEYVDGTTLREKLPVQGIQDAVNYAIQIGEALHEAHIKGIVHRDIKADNIMLNSRNQVKVMDFGLAKIKGSLRLTRSSSTVGTLAYMAPEQVRGEEVDPRSDIFSFGVVLFEMLTGAIPFRGEHEAAVMYSVLNEDPEPVEKYRQDVPAALVVLMQRALEKDPADRYQHADDLVSELRRIQKQSTKVSRPSMEIDRTSAPFSQVRQVAASGMEGAAPRSSMTPASTPITPKRSRMVLFGSVLAVAILAVAAYFIFGAKTGTGERKMLVVLPFENFGASEQEYFADGITEEITTRLSGLSGLGVIARSSAMQYKKTTKTLPQIGEELRAAYVLQGTIRWGTTPDGKPKVRINPALVKVSDATQLWSQSYEAVMSDVFTVQSDIASQVAVALGVTLLQPERRTLEARPTENSDAYDAYLRGNEYFRRSYREQDFRIAIQMLDKAVQLDSRFALAYARLSEVHSAMYWFHYDRTNERVTKAKAAVDESFKLDPGLPDVHQAYAYHYYWCHLDYDNALREFALAQNDRPSDSRILLGIGSVYRRQGKMELAAASMKKATELDPRSSEVARNTGETYRLLRNYPEADRYVNQAIAVAPDLAEGYYEKVFTSLVWNGDTRKVREILRQAAGVTGITDHDGLAFMRVLIEIFDRNYKDALSAISAGQREYGDQFQFAPRDQFLAQVYGLMKHREMERVYYDSARMVLERKVREQPDDARFHSTLGIAYAGLGRKDAAIREGKRGIELLPISKEVWRGAYRVRDLATIYVMVGEHREAINLLRQLLAMPSDMSAALLRIDPTYDRLRNNPDFQRLLQEYGKQL